MYEAPQIFELGTVAEVTMSNTGGITFDQTFNAGEPIPDGFTS